MIKPRPQLGVVLLALAGISIAMLLLEGAGAPAEAGLPAVRGLDKLLHFGAHFWVASLLFWGGLLLGRPLDFNRRRKLWTLLVLLADSAAGLTIELVQLQLGATHGRVFDWKDVSANIAGMAAALAVGWAGNRA
ncbi:MAG: hypothetical protein H6840_00905 [Planctomycetes bacterium]|nr:hypothetical protein [Planctomycetota bacterium]